MWCSGGGLWLLLVVVAGGNINGNTLWLLLGGLGFGVIGSACSTSSARASDPHLNLQSQAQAQLQLNMKHCEPNSDSNNTTDSNGQQQHWVAIPHPNLPAGSGCGASASGSGGAGSEAFRLQLAGTTQCVTLHNTLGEQALTLSECSSGRGTGNRTSGEGDSALMHQLLVNSTDPQAGSGFICGCEVNATGTCDGTGTAPCCLTVAGGHVNTLAKANYVVNAYRRCVGGPPCGNQQWDWARVGVDTSAQQFRLSSVRDGLCLTAGKAPPLPPPPRPRPPPFSPYQGTPTDCTVRQLALDRAVATLTGPALLPADWARLHASLTLDGHCTNLTTPSPPPPAQSTEPAQISATRSSLSAPIIITASPGNFTHALAAARASLTTVGGTVRVRLELLGGLYEMSTPLRLTAADTGLTIVAANHRNPPVLSAGRRLQLAFRRVDHQPLRTSGSDTSTPDVAVYAAAVPMDLVEATQLFDSDSGHRLVRARWPNGDPELWTPSGGNAWHEATGAIPKNWSSGQLVKLGSPIDKLHIPQGGDSLQAFSVLVGGPAAIYAGGRNPAGETYPGGGAGGLVVDQVTAARAMNWTAGPTQAELTVHGLWGSYSYELASVEGTDLRFGKGGSHLTIGCGTGKFIVENSLAELDDVSEWIHDAGSGTVYLGMPESAPEVIQKNLTLAQHERVIEILGSRRAPVTNVTISGLVIAHTQSTRLARPYESPSNGDWTIVRTGAIFAEGVSSLKVTGCRFNRVGGYGVTISGHARDCAVSDNVFTLTGESAIIVVGAYSAGVVSSDHDDFPLHTTVARNYVFHPGVYNLQSSLYFQALAVQSVVKDNLAFDGPRMAIQLNDQMGGGTVIEGNTAFSMVIETMDSGVMHQWGRHPYLTDLNRDQAGVWSLRPAVNRITKNLFIGNGFNFTYGRSGRRFAIETDDASSYIRFDHNVFAYGSTDSWLGHNLQMDHNVLVRVDLSGTDDPTVDSPTCVWSLFDSSYWDDKGGRNLSFVNNTCTTEFGDIYSFGFYPSMVNSGSDAVGDQRQLDPPLAPPPFVHSNCVAAKMADTVWMTASNTFLADRPVSVNCGADYWNFSAWKATGRDAGSVEGALPSVERLYELAMTTLTFPSSR